MADKGHDAHGGDREQPVARSSTPATQPSLLVRLRDTRDQSAWDLFEEVYGPLVRGYLGRRGLQHSDAADVSQDVLRAVARAMPSFRYDASRGTFRAWLFTIVRNELKDFFTRSQRHPRARGGTTGRLILDKTPDARASDSADDVWEQVWADGTFAWAEVQVRRDVRERTWLAFYETAVRERPAEEVAAEVGMSVGALYIARSRVTARLRRALDSIDSGASVPGASSP